MGSVDTICAVSTPPGEGGIGILRLSGPFAHEILKKIFINKGGGKKATARRLYLGYIVDPTNSDKIDEVFAVFLKAPHTYTREEMGEVYSHGGFAVQRRILSLMIACGARLAEPGEFTKRAFLNGRIDLLQAESVRDVIEAVTDEELNCAEKSLQGELSQKIGGLKERIRGALVEVEALIDFPEEDVGVDEKGILSSLEHAREETKVLVDSYYEGNAVRHGLEVLIVGRTNVGKSSLLNRLLAREKAIVTALPGTTRDLIEDTIHIRGIKVRLVDSAGIGRTEDPIEKEGIERVRQRIPEADLILLVFDCSRPLSAEDFEIMKEIGDRRMIVALNKIDLPQFFEKDLLVKKGIEPIGVSALQELGIEDLKKAIYHALMGKKQQGNSLLITNVRHRNGLSGSLEALERAVGNMGREEPAEFIAFDLREALSRLEEITGEACSDDILHDIFSRFCIGK